MKLDPKRSADALAFLRASLTPAEQLWPRFTPELRAIRDVPIGELRTHPDLVERVREIAPAPDSVWMLMGAPVLVTPRGGIYGFGFGTSILALRLGDRNGFPTVSVGTPRSLGGGRFELGDEWALVDPWLAETPRADRRDELRGLAQRALSSAGS
jgi:hypothetical protein